MEIAWILTASGALGGAAAWWHYRKKGKKPKPPKPPKKPPKPPRLAARVVTP